MGKDKGTLNLKFILQVNNCFVMRNFLPRPGKAVYPVGRYKEKKASSFFFGALGSPSFFQACAGRASCQRPPEKLFFFIFVYFILFYSCTFFYFIQSYNLITDV